MTWIAYSVNANAATDPALATEINLNRSRDASRAPAAHAVSSSSPTDTAETQSNSNHSGGNNSKTLMANLLNSFRSRSSSHGGGGGTGNASASTSGTRAGLRRQLSKRKSPPVTSRTTSSSNLSDTDDTDDKDTQRHRIRLLPHLENARSPNFSITTRQLKSGARLRIGRFTDKHEEKEAQSNDTENKLMGGGGDPNSLSLAFRSKVVSRNHAEISVNEDGRFHIKDMGSSSGTFLNHRRLSGSTHASKPYEITDGDVIQLGVDYQGGKDALYRCIKIRVEVGDKMKSPVAFHEKALEQVKEMSVGQRAERANTTDSVSASQSPHNSLDCAICLFPVGICQALFIAPCSHTFHYKCLRGLLNTHFPCFSCPVCRAFADLDEDVEREYEEGVETHQSREKDKDKVEDMARTPANDLPIPTLNGVMGGTREDEDEAEDLTLGLTGC